MFLNVSHQTTYKYSLPVTLEKHTLRLTPRLDSCRVLLDRELKIYPKPAGVTTNLESDGSLSHQLWFDQKSDSFSVESNFLLELHEANPFNFIVYPFSCLTLPMNYPVPVFMELKPFLEQGAVSSTVREFAQKIFDMAKSNAVDFLIILSRLLSKEFAYEFRHAGDPCSPEETLSKRSGSCRDLAVLFIAAARTVGLAARFVSGYYFDQFPDNPQLHAWVEVYIPGGGWRGFDPTVGLACYGHHIALCSGTSPEMTAPIKGFFRGEAVSQMDVAIGFEYLKKLPVKRQPDRKKTAPRFS